MAYIEKPAVPSPCATCPARQFGVCKALGLGSKRTPRFAPHSQTARARSVLVRKGGTANFTILCTGVAIQYVQLADGRRQILALRKPAQLLLGNASFGTDAVCSVQAVTSVSLASIPRDHLLTALAREPDLLVRLAGLFADEVRETTSLLVDLGRRSATERIAHFILRMIEWSNSRVQANQCLVRLPIRQEDMADLLGLTPAHVSRVISQLRREKLIAMRGDTCEVLDHARLKELIT